MKTIELIDHAINKLLAMQKGDNPCSENQGAINSLRQARAWLEARDRRRATNGTTH